MKKLVNATSILSLLLYVVPPVAAQAQDAQTVTIDGQIVICLPNKKAECPEGSLCVVAKKPENCAANATQMLADVAAAAAATTATEVAPAEVAPADTTATDQAAADKAAADQAAADQAAADQAAADKAAADQAAADQAAADKAAKKQAKLDAAKAEADAAAAAAATEAATTDTATTDTATTDTTEPATTEPAAADPLTVMVGDTQVICLPTKEAVCADGAVCVVAKNAAKCDEKAQDKVAEIAAAAATEDAAAIAAQQAAADAAAAAAATDPTITPVEAPVPTDEAVTTLETALDGATSATDPVAATTTEAATATTDLPADGTLPADLPPSTDAVVTTETLTEDDTRASDEEFADAPVVVAPGQKSGLSDFEKVGLVALGALAIGAIINNGKQQVVENTGDRVVVRQPDGTYQVLKDDNALLREPGSTVRTETYTDGSTRTVVQRADASQIVTIRDATGRVLQRVAYDSTGHGTVLIDDTVAETPVVVSNLPKPRLHTNQISMNDDDSELAAQLAAADAQDVGRTFCLRQIRNIAEVRALAPTIDVNNITFESGSAAIQPTEAKKLQKLGALMTHMIEVNPNEVFLIEGHTDAVGSAASNLSLSDRRAESLARALTEYFDVPPENLVVQGYGESELKVQTLGDERKNRRAAVRIITPLLRQAAN